MLSAPPTRPATPDSMMVWWSLRGATNLNERVGQSGVTRQGKTQRCPVSCAQLCSSMRIYPTPRGLASVAELAADVDTPSSQPHAPPSSLPAGPPTHPPPCPPSLPSHLPPACCSHPHEQAACGHQPIIGSLQAKCVKLLSLAAGGRTNRPRKGTARQPPCSLPACRATGPSPPWAAAASEPGTALCTALHCTHQNERAQPGRPLTMVPGSAAKGARWAEAGAGSQLWCVMSDFYPNKGTGGPHSTPMVTQGSLPFPDLDSPQIAS